MTDRWERLSDLYHSVVALPTDERAALIAEECGDDPALQADLERLVAAHDRAHGIDEPSGSTEPEIEESEAVATLTDTAVGPYRILKALGTGSSGTVHLAEREDGRSDRRVALRIVNGADASEILDHVRSVHQTLGSREHSNLGRLIEASTADDGTSFIAMEYVDGEPIDVYCDARRLSVPERLHLFVQVCNAVSHAHRRRVTHGRLTAMNVCVTSAGVPKVLDFGVGPNDGAIATDIHALGLILDGLLGGGAGNGERRKLRDDLEPIVVRALRKENNKRYGSVEHLGDDLRRILDNPAPRARPDGAGGQQQRASSRRMRSPTLAWSLAAAAVALLGIQIGALRPRLLPPTPVAPPVAAPVTRPRIAIADFVDRAGDAQLTAALDDAFRTGLTESPFVQVLSPRQSRAKATVTTSVDTTEGHYAFTARIVDAKGDSIATLRETAIDMNGVITALTRLTEQVRQAMGESASSIASGPRLDEVTTASLPALRAYERAAAAIDAGNRAGGIRLLKTAIAADTGYASAYRLLSLAYRDIGDRTRSADALDHAIANQGRLPFFERYHLVGNHALNVLANYPTAIDAYRRLLERYPNDTRALANLGLAHAARREYAVQDSLLVQAIAVDSSGPSLYASLALSRLNQGEYDRAQALIDRIERRFPGLRSTQTTTIALAASQQDWETAEREARRRVAPSADDTLSASDGIETLAGIVMTQGRLNEATQTLRRVLALGTTNGSGRRYLMAARRIAYLELRYRHSPTAAVATMTAALNRVPLSKLSESERPYDAIARLYADAGQPERARELVAQAGRTRLASQRGIDPDRRWTLGAIAMADGQPWQGEIEILQAAEAHPCPICALPDLARAYEVAGKPDLAIATYERYLETPWQARVETDDVDLGFAMKRLGELYQQQNERAKAAAQYSALLKLWRGADSELEPLLTDVKRRLEQVGN